MKIKPLYIYLIAFVLVIVIIVLTSNSGSNKSTSESITGKEMPQDEIHKGINPPGTGNPSSGNVSKEAIHQMEMLKKSYEENPEDTVKAKVYADMLIASHSPEKSIPIYENILKKDPKRIDILLGLTLANYSLQNFDECEELTLEILKIDEDNPEANYNLGAIAASRGNKEKARKLWQEVIEKYPNSDAARIANTSMQRL